MNHRRGKGPNRARRAPVSRRDQIAADIDEISTEYTDAADMEVDDSIEVLAADDE